MVPLCTVACFLWTHFHSHLLSCIMFMVTVVLVMLTSNDWTDDV